MRRTIEGFTARLLKIDELLVSADPLARLHLTQERIDLHAELVRVTNGQDPDLSTIEKEFVRVARQYGDLAGITFAAWRQVGVDAEVLDQAGIVRTGTPRPDASRVRRAAESIEVPAVAPAAIAEVDAEAPLPRTEPNAPDPQPAPEPAPAPELVLELSEDPPLVPAEAPAPAAQTPPPPPRPSRPKGPKPQKRPAPQAQNAAPAAADGDGEAPKLRRKRIAD
jgi:hypothetical protein